MAEVIQSSPHMGFMPDIVTGIQVCDATGRDYPPTDFAAAVAESALWMIGQPAINHKREAGCNFGDTQPRCVEVGLGREGYDCSGLVIAAISSVVGRAVDVWPFDMRHVRQMHGHAGTEIGTLAVGALLVFGRYYDIGNDCRLVPAHIGVVASANRGAITFVHALDAQQAVVLERLTPQRSVNLLGVISPADLTAP